MEVRFAVFIAVSLDGFIARPDGGIEWLRPFESEEHGYGAFFAGVDALVIGRGTYETVLGFPSWPYGGKRVIVCTSRPANPASRTRVHRSARSRTPAVSQAGTPATA